MGRGRGQGSRAETSRTQGHVYAVVLQTKLANRSDVQGMFRLSHFLTLMLFKFGCIIFMLIVAASSVDVLGLEVENLEEPLHVSSPLGSRVRIDRICRDCESEISGVLLTVDL